jgi:aldehyde dehydrogenase (NAD+)
MNPFQGMYDNQKAYFNTDATKTYEWRIDQLTGGLWLAAEGKDARRARLRPFVWPDDHYNETLNSKI